MILRKVEKLIEGIWTPCEMKDIKAGDKFRLFETNTGIQVTTDANPNGIFLAKEDARCDPMFKNRPDLWEVEIED